MISLVAVCKEVALHVPMVETSTSRLTLEVSNADVMVVVRIPERLGILASAVADGRGVLFAIEVGPAGHTASRGRQDRRVSTIRARSAAPSSGQQALAVLRAIALKEVRREKKIWPRSKVGSEFRSPLVTKFKSMGNAVG